MPAVEGFVPSWHRQNLEEFQVQPHGVSEGEAPQVPSPMWAWKGANITFKLSLKFYNRLKIMEMRLLVAGGTRKGLGYAGTLSNSQEEPAQRGASRTFGRAQVPTDSGVWGPASSLFQVHLSIYNLFPHI